MEIAVNSKSVTVADAITIADYLKSLGLENKKALAVAVNGDIVKRDEHEHFIISPGDSLEIVRAIGGG